MAGRKAQTIKVYKGTKMFVWPGHEAPNWMTMREHCHEWGECYACRDLTFRDEGGWAKDGPIHIFRDRGKTSIWEGSSWWFIISNQELNRGIARHARSY